MSYQAHITELERVYDHPNADRIKLATVFGKQIVVGLDAKPGDAGIYFPSDGQLSHEYCMANNLYRKNPDTGEKMGGYFESNRRVRVIKFRGQLSDGFFTSLSTLDYIKGFPPLSKANVGGSFERIHGHEICKKYERPIKTRQQGMAPWRAKRALSEDYPTFWRVGDTKNINYSLGEITDKDMIYVKRKFTEHLDEQDM